MAEEGRLRALLMLGMQGEASTARLALVLCPGDSLREECEELLAAARLLRVMGLGYGRLCGQWLHTVTHVDGCRGLRVHLPGRVGAVEWSEVLGELWRSEGALRVELPHEPGAVPEEAYEAEVQVTPPEHDGGGEWVSLCAERGDMWTQAVSGEALLGLLRDWPLADDGGWKEFEF